MEVAFEEQYLADLYEGKAKKPFLGNVALIKQYIKTVNKLKSIDRIEDLYQLKSLHYEKKKGDLAGISAVYVNMQYRLLFTEITNEDDNTIVVLIKLIELSKHYE
jgi:toxin HigB-1